MPLLFHTIDDAMLIEQINRAERDVSLVAPGISMAVAEALVDAVSRLGSNVHLVVDATLKAFQMGYCDPEVVRFLQLECLRRNLRTFRCEPGIRIGALTVDGESFFFTPQVLTLDQMMPDCLNAANAKQEGKQLGDPIGKMALSEAVLPEAEMVTVPQSKEEQLQAEIRQQQQTIEALQARIHHLEREKGKLPIQQNLQFVEMEVSQYRLDKLRIRIPAEFLTDANVVNERMDSKYLVMAGDEAEKLAVELTIHGKMEDYTLGRFFEEIETLRRCGTVQLGKWKRVLPVQYRDAFEKELYRLEVVGEAIGDALPRLLQAKVDARLEELYDGLKDQIRRHYKGANWWNTDDSEGAIKKDFLARMQQEAQKAFIFFDPRIEVIFRDISREDAENPEFYREVEKAFGKDAAARLFSEAVKKQ